MSDVEACVLLDSVSYPYSPLMSTAFDVVLHVDGCLSNKITFKKTGKKIVNALLSH